MIEMESISPEVINICKDLSKDFDIDLSEQTIAAVANLIDLGTNPEALASLILELQRQST